MRYREPLIYYIIEILSHLFAFLFYVYNAVQGKRREKQMSIIIVENKMSKNIEIFDSIVLENILKHIMIHKYNKLK